MVLCTASVEEQAPGWRKGTGEGWVTAEYAMLPRATHERTPRERRGAGGRTYEIQRLIGRSLRAAMRTLAIGERTIRIDCDVLQADGGTRTAAITGGAVALADACRWLAEREKITDPFGELVAAVSAGIVEGEVRLDLSYAEDKGAAVDANIVRLASGAYVDVQATAESGPYTGAELGELLSLAGQGLDRIAAAQREALGR
jgi:ribonuclease PH